MSLDKDVYPSDNILYFPKNIDIRICPKNGSSTLRHVLAVVENKPATTYTHVWRLNQVSRMGDILDLPFRKGSYRIAIKRDPVDRFKSACEYLARQDESHTYTYGWVIDRLENCDVRDIHFCTQSLYMGKPKSYDAVYDIKDLSKLLMFLKESLKCSNEVLDFFFNKTSERRVKEDLTKDEEHRIKKLYRIDYRYGWGTL